MTFKRRVKKAWYNTPQDKANGIISVIFDESIPNYPFMRLEIDMFTLNAATSYLYARYIHSPNPLIDATLEFLVYENEGFSFIGIEFSEYSFTRLILDEIIMDNFKTYPTSKHQVSAKIYGEFTTLNEYEIKALQTLAKLKIKKGINHYHDFIREVKVFSDVQGAEDIHIMDWDFDGKFKNDFNPDFNNALNNLKDYENS